MIKIYKTKYQDKILAFIKSEPFKLSNTDQWYNSKGNKDEYK
jgi:hypothetical protein